MSKQVPWQLKMFQKSLKKKLRLKALKKHLGNLSQVGQFLLVTCGDNNGAMNYHLRALGGKWQWADLEDKSLAEMAELLGEKVLHVPGGILPFSDGTFDCVVSIDVHEHLANPHFFTSELRRVTKDGGRIVVTVPNGDEKKLATRIKNAVGMTKEKYGHVVEGYDIPELKQIFHANGITPLGESSFSGFFTEMLELTINFAYVMILANKSKARVEQGTIAPSSRDQLKSVEKTYKMYSLIYPFFLAISKLDLLLFWSRGYVVVVNGQKG